MKRQILILLFFITCSLFYGNISIVPPTWDFGQVKEGMVLEKEIDFTNNSSDTVHIDIISTCDCISSKPEKLTLQPGETNIVLFVLDTHDEIGDLEKIFIIKADLDGFERKYYFITGKVNGDQESITKVEEIPSDDEHGRSDVEMDYYYSPSCAICAKFINSTIPHLEKNLDIIIQLNKKDIFDPEMYKEYISRLNKLGEKERAVPLLFIGSTVLQGNKEIDSKLKEEIKKYLKNKESGTDENSDQSGGGELVKEMAILPAIGAGLIDGINPCAFATLISLLAALALAGKRRKEILVIGIFFTLSVFTTYYLVGVGIFKVIQAASSIHQLVAQIIRWALVGVLVVFAGLSLYDYYLIRVGRSKEMVLQLPDSFKKRIQKSIKTRVRSAAIVASSVVLGFLVSIFELACTGQVYFPFITVYVLKIEQDSFGYILLLIYNLGFILPLVGVFAIVYSGISSKKITNLFQKHMSIVKILLALLFIGLALFVIFSK